MNNYISKTALLKIASLVAFVLCGTMWVEANAGVAEEGYNFTRISGTSMLPTLTSGEVAVVYENYPYKKLRVGDVVIIESKNGYNVIHRITRRYRGGLWVTKGDNNRYEDREVLSSKNFAGLALVGESMNRYHQYLAKNGLEPRYGVEKDQVALASSKGTIR